MELRESQSKLASLAQALRAEPGSIPRRLEFAAALRALGRYADAIEVYRSIAEVFAEEGHLLQAISICKGILEIDPQHRQALEMLASLASGRRSGRLAAQALEEDKPYDDELDSARPQLELGHDNEAADEFDAPSDTARMDRPSVLSHVDVEGIFAEQGGVPPAATSADSAPLYGDDATEISAVNTRVDSPGGERRRRVTPARVATASPSPSPPAKSLSPTALSPTVADFRRTEPSVPVITAPVAAVDDEIQPSPDDLYADQAAGLYAEEEESISRALHEPIPHTVLKDPPHFPLLSDLPRPAFMDLMARMALIRVDAGVRVLSEGEIGDAAYLIAKGSVRVVKGAIEVARLAEGSFFGEFAVLADQRRHASVETIEPCELLEIRRSLIDELVAEHPGVARTLRAFYRERLLQTLLATAPFFEKLQPEERNAIAERFRPRRFGRGSLIVEQGTPGGGLYLILVGQVQVVHQTPEGDNVLGTLDEGSYFGEMSLLRAGVASASVKTTRMTEVVQLPPRDFYEVVSQHPVLWEHLRAEAERREMLNHQIISGEARSSNQPIIYLV